MEAEEAIETGKIKSSNIIDGIASDISKAEDVLKQLYLDTSDTEDEHSIFQKNFQEEDLISKFTFDCPPAKDNILYRLLHRLDINSSDFLEFEDNEEDFWSVVEETKTPNKTDLSHLFANSLPRDSINIVRLLLESRFAIPLCSMDILQLLRVTQRIEENVFLGEDLKLPRIGIISQVKNNRQSYTGKMMEDLFNVKTSFGPSESSNIEVGQGLVDLGNKKTKNCVVVHIQGNFEDNWKSLIDFVDYLVVEDKSSSEYDLEDYFVIGEESSLQSAERSHFISKYSRESLLPQFITVWMNTNAKKISVDRPFCLIQGSYDYFIEMQKNRHLRKVLQEAPFHEIPLHAAFPSDGHLRSKVDILRQMCMHILEMEGLENYRSNVLLLQKSFVKEGKLQEKLNDFKFINDSNERFGILKQISQEHEFRSTWTAETNPLILYFLRGLQNKNIDEILLHLQVLEDAIAQNIKKSRTVSELDDVLRENTKNFTKILQASAMDPDYEKQVELSRQKLLNTKETRNNALLSLRHLWREVSLLYSSGGGGELEYLPQRAASWLVAGETLELYDGDANMLNVEWITAVFRNLTSLLQDKRIFILSVLGEQSSGKSTLLNTMFGIRLPSSVGQCTRGLTMTLLKTVDRHHYDYVMIFDTEGVRSPEHKGLQGCVKRDNKIATLSILPSDATILVVKGENDNALKDILPIVALAYKGSKLAEEREGILGCKIFAAYNQVKVDFENKNKLQNIFSQLSATLVESFAKANSLEDLDIHTSVSFPKLFTNEQDIRVFGCNTKGDTPNDVPNDSFSLQMIDFREHIHEQVVNQSGWRARHIGSLERYLCLVWDCLKNANFDLSFETVLERYVYTELENKYQFLRKDFYEKYEMQYNLFKDKFKRELYLKEEKPMSLEDIYKVLEAFEVKMKPQIEKFVEEVDKIFEGNQNQKWKTEYSRKCDDLIRLATMQWRHKLEVVLRNHFTFDMKVKEYEKEIRDKITEEFRASSIKDKSEAELISMFNISFEGILKRVKEENSPLDVKDAALKAYKENSTIVNLGIDLLSYNGKPSFFQRLRGKTKEGAKTLIDPLANWFTQKQIDGSHVEKMVVPMLHRVAKGRKYYCDAVVDDLITEIETSIRRGKVKMDKNERKKIHRAAYDMLVVVFGEIQATWEQENSVYVRYQSMKEVMQRYCLDIARGLEEVDIVASRLEDFFSRHTDKAFKSEIEVAVLTNLRRKCWPQSPKYVQGHMDLYLIEEVESEGIGAVLSFIKKPEELKKLTTVRLISFEIDIALKNLVWFDFKNQLVACLRDTYENDPIDGESGSNSFYFCQFLKRLQAFKSQYIAEELRREMERFGWSNIEKISMKLELRHINAIVAKIPAFFSILDTKSIIDSVYLQLKESSYFDAAFCTSCQEKCPLCKSFCYLEFSHEGCHDCVHQPKGITGWREINTQKLTYHACNTCPPDHKFILHNDGKHRYADFSKKFNTWRQPDRTQLISEYRQYLISMYNKEIAEYYNVNPSDTVDPAESLDVVTSKIKRRLDFFKDFPQQ